MLNFKVSKSEMLTIAAIVKRAMVMAEKIDSNYKPMDCDMDITACHCNGNRLDLKRLLERMEKP